MKKGRRWTPPRGSWLFGLTQEFTSEPDADHDSQHGNADRRTGLPSRIRSRGNVRVGRVRLSQDRESRDSESRDESQFVLDGIH